MNGAITHDITKTPDSTELAHRKLKLNFLSNEPQYDRGRRCREAAARAQHRVAMGTGAAVSLPLKIAPEASVPRQRKDKMWHWTRSQVSSQLRDYSLNPIEYLSCWKKNLVWN